MAPKAPAVNRGRCCGPRASRPLNPTDYQRRDLSPSRPRRPVAPARAPGRPPNPESSIGARPLRRHRFAAFSAALRGSPLGAGSHQDHAEPGRTQRGKGNQRVHPRHSRRDLRRPGSEPPLPPARSSGRQAREAHRKQVATMRNDATRVSACFKRAGRPRSGGWRGFGRSVRASEGRVGS
jgi:hypothetical protein